MREGGGHEHEEVRGGVGGEVREVGRTRSTRGWKDAARTQGAESSEKEETRRKGCEREEAGRCWESFLIPHLTHYVSSSVSFISCHPYSLPSSSAAVARRPSSSRLRHPASRGDGAGRPGRPLPRARPRLRISLSELSTRGKMMRPSWNRGRGRRRRGRRRRGGAGEPPWGGQVRQVRQQGSVNRALSFRTPWGAWGGAKGPSFSSRRCTVVRFRTG